MSQYDSPAPCQRLKKDCLRSPFGIYLRERRLKHLNRGLTVIELAELARVHQTTITLYETGRTHPRRHVCDRVADALRLDKADLWQRCQDSRRSFGDTKKREVGPRTGEVSVKTSITLPLDIYRWMESLAGEGPVAAVHRRIVRAAYNSRGSK